MLHRCSEVQINIEDITVLLTDLQTGVGPVVVRALLPGDASCRATFTLVPEAHSPLLGLLEDLDLRFSHWRAQMIGNSQSGDVERKR